MPEPLAYFLTWTCYGTWLPGDGRGWVDKHDSRPDAAFKSSDPELEAKARTRLKEPPASLAAEHRALAEEAIRETCRLRGWFVHRLNVRSNHVHVVVTAPRTRPEAALQALKANATQRLNRATPRKHWWTEGGSKRYLNDERSVHAAIAYVRDQ
jgi:REP element-mobilizing transposase RayT